VGNLTGYPILDEAQIAQAANCTTLAPKRYRDGETIWTGMRISEDRVKPLRFSYPFSSER